MAGPDPGVQFYPHYGNTVPLRQLLRMGNGMELGSDEWMNEDDPYL